MLWYHKKRNNKNHTELQMQIRIVLVKHGQMGSNLNSDECRKSISKEIVSLINGEK